MKNIIFKSMNILLRLTFTNLFLFFSTNTLIAQVMYLDSSFGTNGRATFYYNGRYDETLVMAIQNNGKIVLAGDATYQTSTLKWKVGRLNTNGTIDTTFNIPVVFPDSGSATAIKIQSDSKILVAGSGPNGEIILRYNNSGTIDSTFNDSGYVSINTLAVNILQMNNDKIIVVGNNGYYQTEIIRLNTDGTIDSSYGVNGFCVLDTFYTISSVSMQSDGRLILDGDANGIIEETQLRRIDTTGFLDSSFGNNGIVTVPQVIYNSFLQPDDKIISLCGGEDTISHYPFTIMYRFHADGSLDSTFHMVDSSFITHYIDGLVLQNSKILFSITRFDIDSIGFIQLNPDGSIDSTFPTENANLLKYSDTKKMLIQPDGKILVSNYGMSTVQRFIRDFTNSISNVERSDNKFYVFQENGYLGIQMRGKITTQILIITFTDLYGKKIKEITTENIQKDQNKFFIPIGDRINTGVYLISLFTSDNRKYVKRIFIN